MKDTLLSVIIFCLVLAVVTAFCTLAFAVYLIGSRLFLFPAVTPEMLLKVVPAAWNQVFLPSVLLSLFFALVRMRRRPGLVFLSYLLLGALAFTALSLGPRLVAAPLNVASPDAEIAKIRATGTVSLRDLEYPRLLIPLKGAYLYFDRKEGADLVNGFLVDTTRPAPRVVFFDRAPVTAGADATRLGLPPPEGSRVLEPQAEESAVFAPDAQVRSVLGFFQGVNERYLAVAGGRQADFIVVCLVFTLLVLSSSLFLRVTRWPLANAFITLLVLSLILALYNLLTYQLLGEVRKITGDSFVLGLLPNALLALVSLVFFLFDFVFLPEKRREGPDA